MLEIVLTQAGFAVVTADQRPRRHRPGPQAPAGPGDHRRDDAGHERARGRPVASASSAGTYIVIISSRSQEHDILAGFDAGADDYVPKPIRPRELRARLAAVARRPVAGDRRGAAAVGLGAGRRGRRALGVPPPGRRRPVRRTSASDARRRGGRAARTAATGMLELGMRFVGSWIEFRGLRINPARDLSSSTTGSSTCPRSTSSCIETLLYAGTRTLTSRQLALRLRGETEQTPTHDAPSRTERWFDALMPKLLSRIGDDVPVAALVQTSTTGKLPAGPPRRTEPPQATTRPRSTTHAGRSSTDRSSSGLASYTTKSAGAPSSRVGVPAQPLAGPPGRGAERVLGAAARGRPSRSPRRPGCRAG